MIKETEHGLHSGLLYKKDGDEEVRILHLAFHYALRDEVDDGTYRWVQLGLDTDNKIVLASQLSKVIRSDVKIPYGFNAEGVAFDPVTGDLLPSPTGRGLTCATFMSAILRSFAHPLLDQNQWPERSEDREWQNRIIVLLEEHAQPEHVAAVRNDIGAKRLRPDEVVGACSSSAWPVSFPTARDLADQVLKDLADL